jgi:DNA-binding HxlR family transcriptional regulator
MVVNGKEMEIRMNGKTYHCALDITMDYIGGKWKSVVLWYLIKEHKRFSELKRLIPDITEKMLSLQLKQLEKDGLIGRRAFAEVPPRVEYFLTKEGRSIVPVIEAIALWGRTKGKASGIIQEVEKIRGTKVKKTRATV